MVRDNDSSSSFLWGAIPGRKAAAGKESQFSNFWDKAVHGAQKLLGLEGELQKEQGKRQGEAERSEGEESLRSVSLSATPGFGSGGFGGLTRSVRQRPVQDLVAFSRMEQPREERTAIDKTGPQDMDGDRLADRSQGVEASNELDGAESRAHDNRDGSVIEGRDRPEKAQEAEPEGELEDDEEDNGAAAEKSAAQTLAMMPAVASSLQSGKILDVEGKEVAYGYRALGIDDATKAQTMTTGTKSPVAEISRRESVDTTISSLSGSAGVIRESEQTTDQKAVEAAVAALSAASGTGNNALGRAGKLEGAGGIGQPAQQRANLPSNQKVGAPEQTDRAQPSPTVGVTVPAQGKGAQGETLVQPISGQAGDARADSLTFDGEKARRDLSESLRRAPELNRPMTVSTSPAQTQVAKATAPASPMGEGPLAAGNKAETSPMESAPILGAKPEASAAGSSGSQAKSAEAATTSRPLNAPMTGAEPHRSPAANASQASAEASATAMQRQMAQGSEAQAAVNRELRPADTRPIANRGKSHASQHAGLAVGQAGQAGSVSQAQAGSLAQSQPQQNFQRGSKQESGPALNAGPNAKVEKTDGGTAFSLGQAQTQGTRRGEASARLEQPTYSSKTPEEVKEVYQALSKGVERMINSKSDTISVRINFQQGGSLSLKLSMDQGQVKASMQTDLPGLESMIKSHWSELASDWNARGVKLNAPQFTHEGGDVRNENFMTFEQREERQAQAQGGEQRNGRGPNRGGAGNSAQQTTGADLAPSATSDAPESIVSETELKTYA